MSEISHPPTVPHRICFGCLEALTNDRPERAPEIELATCCFCGQLRNIDLYVPHAHPVMVVCGLRWPATREGA